MIEPKEIVTSSDPASQVAAEESSSAAERTLSQCESRFITKTSVGTEGVRISYSAEKRCADELQKILPNDWSVEFHWLQIALLDVAYKIHVAERRVEVFYNRLLSYWQDDLVHDVECKVRGLTSHDPSQDERETE